jgi:hypothetical protein
MEVVVELGLEASRECGKGAVFVGEGEKAIWVWKIRNNASA